MLLTDHRLRLTWILILALFVMQGAEAQTPRSARLEGVGHPFLKGLAVLPLLTPRSGAGSQDKREGH